MASKFKVIRFEEIEESRQREYRLRNTITIFGESKHDREEISNFIKGYLHITDMVISFSGNGLFHVWIPERIPRKELSRVKFFIFRKKAFKVLANLPEISYERRSVYTFWVRMLGVPYGWRTSENFEKIITFGQLIEVCPNTISEKDIRWCRVLVSVYSRDFIPENRPFIIYRDDEPADCGKIFFIVEDDTYQSSWYDAVRKKPLLQ